MTGPDILCLALQPECADLLGDLEPLDESQPSRVWRSIGLPLRRYRALMRRDQEDLLQANPDGEMTAAFRGAGSDAAFLETYLPHIAAEARLTARLTSSAVGRDITATVSLASVVAALSSSVLGIAGIPEGLSVIDEDVAAFTRPRASYRDPVAHRPVPNLVSAYLQAKEKESA
ncbi:hypothetical protein NS220_13475 [Microbacterium testaceum]|uniref:Uncharacterized protein n=1 Tax=Microbacterium testaceum TaxID=2033 RepID=A0A147EUP1_MICTE|nr:hypothetical protein NS220_13475 [Microbacterium testaceum]